MHVNVSALVAVAIFSGALLTIFGALYAGADRAYRRGELAYEGIRILRWALVGHIVMNLILALTAFVI